MDPQRHQNAPGANRWRKQNIWREFMTWVDKNKREGTCLNSRNRTHYFIPQGFLKSYWTDERLEKCLEALQIGLSMQIVKDELLHVLSTLLRISDEECSEVTDVHGLFRGKNRVKDDRLPLSKQYSRDCFREPRTAEKFYNTQFLFTPASIERDPWDNTLEPFEVLPLKLLGVLQEGDGRSTPRVAKYQAYSGSSLSEELLVIKEFPPSEVKLTYQAEISAYEAVHLLGDADRDSVQRYFLDCRAAFKQGDRAAIVREYAEGRSLQEWLDQSRIPYTPGGVRQLWSELINLYRALGSFQSIGFHESNRFGSPTTLTHHDITPANIYVVVHPHDGSPGGRGYGKQRISFKLGDLSWNRERQAMMSGMETPQFCSPKNYVAPELFIQDGDDTHVRVTGTQHSDLWSLSCLMLEVAVWLVGGSQAATEFFQTRVEENRARGCSPVSPSVVGYEGCFHDGTRALRAVRNVETLSKSNRRVFDGITGKIVEYVLEHGLSSEPRLRGDAALTARRLQEIIDDPRNLTESRSPELPPSPAATVCHPDAATLDGSAEDLFGGRDLEEVFGARYLEDTVPAQPLRPRQRPSLRRPSTKTQSGPTSPPISPKTSASFPPVPKPPKHDKVTVDYVINYRNSWKFKTEADPHHAMHPFLADVKQVLDGRDQIFLIDDYSTMIPHASQLKRTLEAIAKVVKSVDKDGMELRFASNPLMRHTVHNAADLAGLLQNARGNMPSSSSSMAAAVRAILAAVLDKNDAPRHHHHHHSPFSWLYTHASAQPTGTNIYVMTSGVWGQRERREYDVTLGVARVIQDFIRSQQRGGRLETHTVIQMVSFGHDEVGLERLRRLDDDLWSTQEGPGSGGGETGPRGSSGAHPHTHWDIVDTKAHTECMWSILLGAMDKQEDDRPSDTIDASGPVGMGAAHRRPS